MQTYIALLYSIVLPQGRRLVMSDLKAMAGRLGLSAPRTYVATGNLVFESKAKPIATLETMLEKRFAEDFGKHIDFILRDAHMWLELVAANPFPQQSHEDAARVIVRVQRAPLTQAAFDTLQPYLTDGEQIASVGGNLWAYFPHSPSQSRLLRAMTHKRLGVGTARNWNTVRKLGEMVGGAPDESRS